MHGAKRLPGHGHPVTSAAGLAFAALLAAAPAAAAPGDLDPAFGADGRVFVDVPGDDDIAATALLQVDGKLVIGRTNDAATDDFSVLRLDADGSPDPGFGRDGRTTLDIPDVNATTRVLLQLPEGSIIAAGAAARAGDVSNTDLGMVRYNSHGSVDIGFGVNGVVLRDLGGRYEAINAIVQQANGRLVVGGYTDASGTQHMALAGFHADGSVDTSFGINGSLIVNFHGNDGPDEVGWLVQQPDGKLLAVGTAWPSRQAERVDIGVVRLTADGGADTAFGDQGKSAVNIGTTQTWGSYFVDAAGIALQPDGRILLAGLTGYNVWDYTTCVPVLARLNTDGSLDRTFGGSGAVRPIPWCANVDELAIDQAGDIHLAGGVYQGGGVDLFVARVLATGDLDASFGVAGLAIVDLGRASYPSAKAYTNGDILRQPDGRIVAVASTATADWEPQLVVARLLADGDHAGVLGFWATSGWEVAHAVREEPETAGVIEIPVRRSGGASGTVTIDFETASGSAESGVDFTETAGTLTWADGDRADKIIPVSIADDAEGEDDESFTLVLTNPAGGASLATTELTIVIQSDERPPRPAPPAQPAPVSAGGGSGALGWDAVLALALLLLGSRTSYRAPAPPKPATAPDRPDRG